MLWLLAISAMVVLTRPLGLLLLRSPDRIFSPLTPAQIAFLQGDEDLLENYLDCLCAIQDVLCRYTNDYPHPQYFEVRDSVRRLDEIADVSDQEAARVADYLPFAKNLRENAERAKTLQAEAAAHAGQIPESLEREIGLFLDSALNDFSRISGR